MSEKDSAGAGSDRSGSGEGGEAGNAGAGTEVAGSAVSGGSEHSASEAAQEPGETPSVAEVIGALSLRDEITYSWHTVEELADANPDVARGLIEQAYKYQVFVPAVAGAIAHEEDPAVEVAWPTAEQVKRHALPGVVVGILDHLPGGLGTRADRFIEHQARERIERMARAVVGPIRAITQFESPQAEFVTELQQLYEALVGPAEAGRQHGRLASELRQFLGQFHLWHVTAPDGQRQARNPQLQHERYPLLDGLVRSLPHFNVRIGLLLRGHLGVRVAAPEIVMGIEQFLRARGVDVPHAEIAQQRTLLRGIVNRFAAKTLRSIPDQVETALQRAYDLLPEDGAKFRAEVLSLLRRVNEEARPATTKPEAPLSASSNVPSAGDGPCPDNDPDCRRRRLS